MRLHREILYVALAASIVPLASCSNGYFGSPPYLAVAISPRPASVPAGGTIVLIGTVSNNLSLPQWSILDASETGNPGTLTPVNGSTNSILYTAPSTPPIYTGAASAALTQGVVTVDVSATAPPQSALPVAHDSISFFITAPAITVGLSPANVTVPLNTTEQFTGYAVGSVNNAVTWQVDAVTGGSTADGTISATGLYTAPANLPVTGNFVTITVLSQADPTRTASALVTLQ